MEKLQAPASARESGRAALSAALVERAQQKWTAGDVVEFRQAITSAIPLDPTPASRYLYAERLADLGDLDAAIAQLEQAWELARRISSPVWRARCCHALAELHREAGRADLANRCRQWAIRAELDSDGDVDAAVWLHDRAAESLATGELDDSETLLEAALRVAHRDPELQARVRCAQGVLSVRRGRWSQGLRSFLQSFQMLRRAGDWRGCAAAVVRVGCVLQMRGEWRRARVCFAQAARTLERRSADRPSRQAARYRDECARMLAALTADPARN